MTDVPFDPARAIHHEALVHMPTTDHRYRLCDGAPYDTQLLATDTEQWTTYPMCPQCWAKIMGGGYDDGPPAIPDTAAHPKEIHDHPSEPEAPATVDPPGIVHATATRLDLPEGDRRP